MRLPQKFALKNGKPNSRRTYRRETAVEPMQELHQLSLTEPVLRKSETSLYE